MNVPFACPSALTIGAIRERLLPVLKKHGAAKAIVFGSVARGEPSPRSDVDLIVIKETDKRFLDRYDGVFAELSQALDGPALDLLVYTPAELERMRERRFISQALEEGVVIYERDR